MRVRPALTFAFALSLAPSLLPAQAFVDPAMKEDGVDEAFAALREGRFEAAVPHVEALAAQDNRHGLLLLALMQFTGAGVELDQEAGMNSLRGAADHGNATAARELLVGGQQTDRRVHHWRGLAARRELRTASLPENLAFETDDRLHLRYRAAIAWNQQRAGEGDPVALYNLARFAELAPNLVGLKREDAVRGLLAAAQAGSRTALHALQNRLVTEGDEDSSELALGIRNFTQEAAENGDAVSQFLLGNAILAGESTADDYAQALAWLEAAADQGHEPAAVLLFTEVEAHPQHPWNAEKIRTWRDLAAAAHAPARAQQLLEIIARDEANAWAIIGEFDKLSRDDERVLLLYADLLWQHPDLHCGGTADYVERLQAAFDSGNVAAGHRAGKLLLRGRIDLLPNNTRGCDLLRRAADQGSLEAQQDLNLHELANVDQLLDGPLTQNLRHEPPAKNKSFVVTDDRSAPTHFAPEAGRPPIPSEAELRRLHDALGDRGENAQPVVLFQCKPEFPPDMHQQNIEGHAIVSFVVDSQGVPREVRTIEASAPVFGAEAAATVARWRFAPGLKNGRRVNTRLQVPIIFNISE